MTRIIVLGAGVMGTAITTPMADNGMTVRLIGTHLDDALISGMRRDRIHPRLRAPIGETVEVFDSTEMAAAFAEAADLVVIGVSTPGISWAVDRLAEHLRGEPDILMLTKGIAETPDRIEILPELVGRELSRRGVAHGPIGAVGGPCIAGELAVRHQSAVAIGFHDPAPACQWAEAMTTDYYQVRATADFVGLEICAALKNFYAIGVSTAAGRADTVDAVNGAALHNATAALFNQAVDELALIVTKSGGNPATARGLAGVGDLHVTCQAGRNSRLGRLMGGGMRYSAAMDGPLAGETVEGVLVAKALKAPLEHWAQEGEIEEGDLPLAFAIIAAIGSDTTFEIDWARLNWSRHDRHSA